jgi:hypothetical protein
MHLHHVQTWSNLGDALVKRAEVLAEAGGAEASIGAAYSEAMAAYGRACQLSASEAGDDLPGLLHNWGVGLHSLGTHTQVPTRCGSLECVLLCLETITFACL